MGMQTIQFEFPEGDDADVSVEPSKMETLDLKNPQSHLEKKPEAEKPEVAEDDVELEIVSDVPKKDRGRKPSDPPEDPTEEELESYSEKVRNRIKHFTKGYHDERRAKEAAIREREELERLTRQLMEENNKLKETGSKSQQALLEQAKKNADTALIQAQNEYKSAYNEGDPDKLLAAQEKLIDAKNRVQKLADYKLPPLQTQERSVDVSKDTSKPVTQQSTPVDEKAERWVKDNPWFNTDTEMTAFALGLHHKLVSSGVDPKSDEYYERLNARMRQVFPEQFDDEAVESERTQKPATVVAPASRSTTPKKVTLTETQVALAKRLGLTPKQYAEQVALEMRKR